MRFWIIQAQENPPQLRASLNRRLWRSNTLSEELADRGHTVIRWRSTFSHQQKKQLRTESSTECLENYHHQYIKANSYRSHVGLSRIISHRALAVNFKRIATSYKHSPDLIHVANAPLELCTSAVSFATSRDIPVIIDIRDLWPDSYLDLLPNIIKKSPLIYDLLLYCLRSSSYRTFQQASGITALTSSYLNWGLNLASRKSTTYDAVFPMSYPTPQQLPVHTLDLFRSKYSLTRDHIVGCYVGNLGSQSDFETLVKAAELLHHRSSRYRLIIAGSGPRATSLHDRVLHLPNVCFAGWLEGDELNSLLQISSIGHIAYNPSQNFLLNVPNKFPEYLSHRLAIACGIDGEMGSLVTKHSCGFVYNHRDHGALASSIEHLISHPEMLQAFSSNSKRLHANLFSASAIFPRFADHLEYIASNYL